MRRASAFCLKDLQQGGTHHKYVTKTHFRKNKGNARRGICPRMGSCGRMEDKVWSLKGTFLQLPPMSYQKIRPVDPGVGQKAMETKSKMAGIAAILDEWRSWSSKGTFLQSPPMSHQKIDQSTQKIDGSQIQDGGRSGHLGWAAELIIETNFPVVTSNKPQKNRTNPRWRPYWMSSGADHRKGPSSSHPQ
jgi:hypothetical protein